MLLPEVIYDSLALYKKQALTMCLCYICNAVHTQSKRGLTGFDWHDLPLPRNSLLISNHVAESLRHAAASVSQRDGGSSEQARAFSTMPV